MYKNILVINLMHIGDLMLVTPVLRTLRTNYPEARLSLLADKKLADLVQYNKHIDEFIPIDKKGYDNTFVHYAKFIREIRRRKFDLVINLHRNERASCIAAFSGAKKIVGYSKPVFSWFFDKVMENKKAVKHQIHSHFDVLREAVGVTKIDDGGLEMWLPDSAYAKADKIWEDNFGTDSKLRVVAFNIGASWKTKRWCDDYFAEAADQLIDKGYGIVFFGGPMDCEIVKVCIEKMKQKDSERLVVLTGKVSLQQLAALLKKCALFLTTDSGPMHIAVAQNVPVVTMFGASPVPGFYPYDAKDILVKTPEKCHPCGIHECPKQGRDHMACMKNIPVEVVMKYTMELLHEYEDKTGDVPRIYGQYACKVIEL
jgi:heptosyltransferase II